MCRPPARIPAWDKGERRISSQKRQPVGLHARDFSVVDHLVDYSAMPCSRLRRPLSPASPDGFRIHIVCCPPGEPEAAALARWGLAAGDLPQGLQVYVGPCHAEHTHAPPILVCHWPTGTASKRQAAGHEQALNEALGWSLEERERLRRWKAQEVSKEPAE